MKTHKLSESLRLEERVKNYCIEKHLFSQGDKVVLGVSGGADSVCLLFALHSLREALGISLNVVHVNHGIRRDAGEDAEYVRKLCEKLDVPYFLTEVDVKALQKQWKCSEEEAGRRVRYDAFSRQARVQGAEKIAVAHHKNDRAETLLFQLFRGSGLTGMGSMKSTRRENEFLIVRPLLCLTRKEIEEYLQEKGISYQTDSTNNTDEYARNRIRHHILSYAEENISSRVVEHLCRTADMAAEMEEYMQLSVDTLREKCVVKKEDGSILLSVKDFLEAHVSLQKLLLYTLLRECFPKGRDISYVHVEDLWNLCQKEGNRSLDLPFQIRGSRSYDKIILEKIKSGQSNDCTEKEEAGIVLQIPEKEASIELPNGKRLLLQVFYQWNWDNLPKKPYTKWFDCDKIKGCLEIRKRIPGDYIELLGEKEQIIQKKINRYMIDEKIPAREREDILMMTTGNRVIWILGGRSNDMLRVTEKTKRVLCVSLQDKI